MHRIRNRSEPGLGFRVWSGNRGSGARFALPNYGYRPQTLNPNPGERAMDRGGWSGDDKIDDTDNNANMDNVDYSDDTDNIDNIDNSDNEDNTDIIENLD